MKGDVDGSMSFNSPCFMPLNASPCVNKINILDCKQLLGNNDELIGLLNTIVNLVRISVPILLVLFGSIDFCLLFFCLFF